MAGIVQLRNDTALRRYCRRLLADGKTRWKPCGACAAALPTSLAAARRRRGEKAG